MRDRFLNFIEKKGLFTPNNNLLVGVSGGIDSTVLLDLLVNAGFKCSVAHCNFQLRASESYGDQEFVEQLCKKYEIKCHTIRFDTKEFAQQKKLSIQMAARELRFNWFDELMKLHNYDYIVLAHNADDVIETFHLNLARGTGIRGLTGIKPKINNIVRPLLFAYRSEIIDYSKENKLTFREDSSNSETKYARNKIRHKVIPVFDEINPAYRTTLIQNIEKLHDVAEIYDNAIAEAAKKCITKTEKNTYIQIDELKRLSPLSTYLFEFLRDYGFNAEQLNGILNVLDGHVGKEFISQDYRLVRDRKHLIIAPLTTIDHTKILIEKHQLEDNQPLSIPINETHSLELTLKDQNDDFTASIKNSIESFDYDKLEFPLSIEPWKTGDFFYPFGMKQRKKISDFFVDRKLNRIEKNYVQLLKSLDKVLWVIGYRMDNRFRISDKTKKVLWIEYRKLY